MYQKKQLTQLNKFSSVGGAVLETQFLNLHIHFFRIHPYLQLTHSLFSDPSVPTLIFTTQF